MCLCVYTSGLPSESKEEGISKNKRKGNFGLFMLCHTTAIVARQSICNRIRGLCRGFLLSLLGHSRPVYLDKKKTKPKKQ